MLIYPTLIIMSIPLILLMRIMKDIDFEKHV